MHIVSLSMIVFRVLILIFLITSCTPSENDSWLIENVIIIDGLGNPPLSGSIRIVDDRIVDIGKLKPKEDEQKIDGEGLHLSPGFVDTHSHHDWERTQTYKAAVSQGITTIIVGQDGSSKFPLGPYLDTLEVYPAPLNIGSYIGHNTLRREVLGMEDYKRTAHPEEVEEMKKLISDALNSGALGLSTGLEYDPGIYSTKEEVVNLAKHLKQFGGRYISHMRSEDVGLEDAIEEIINIGKEAEIPVQISHFKLARKGLWGKAASMLERLDDARAQGIQITADVYPYQYWSSTMTVLFPKRDFENIESAKFAITELTTPEGMIISRFEADTTYEGKTLQVIAAERGQDPEQTYLDLIKMSREVPGESIIAKSMSKEDVYTLLAWEHSNVGSDGAAQGHPRGWGSFPKYFHEASSLSISERIKKMTSQSAKNIGLVDIGQLTPGAYADLVLFDPETLSDRATFENSSLPSVGISKVWVSGKLVFEDESMTGERPGRVVRREGY